MDPHLATKLGIMLQLLGSALIVYFSFRTARALKDFPAEQTWVTTSPSALRLATELASQFRQQVLGFVFITAGAGFQLYAA